MNEHATLDGVVYFFSFELTKLLTLFKEYLFCGEHVPYTADTNRKRVIVNSTKRNLPERLFLECQNGHGK